MPMEYRGQAASATINGEVKLGLEENGLTMTAPFDIYYIPYADITVFESGKYHLGIMTGVDYFTLTRLGNVQEAFYEELYAAYNRKVRQALFVQGKPLFETRGEYQYIEDGNTTQGTALIEIYKNCVLLLPPNDGTRRIPLCFLSAMDQGRFELTLRLNTGESYSFIRLGYDTRPFTECIERCLHTLRENSVQAIKEMDGGLSAAQIAAIARLMPEGVAVPLSRLYQIAPSFVTALEGKIAASRAAEEYKTFKEICDPMQICVGMKSDLAGEDRKNILWLIVPGKKSGTAAVELATSEETAAATFIYQAFDDWEIFWRKLGQSMEAIDFKREVIRLSDDELRKLEYANYAMAIKRNSALRFIRSYFKGRVVHFSPEQWRRELYIFML